MESVKQAPLQAYLGANEGSKEPAKMTWGGNPPFPLQGRECCHLCGGPVTCIDTQVTSSYNSKGLGDSPSLLQILHVCHQTSLGKTPYDGTLVSTDKINEKS